MTNFEDRFAKIEDRLAQIEEQLGKMVQQIKLHRDIARKDSELGTEGFKTMWGVIEAQRKELDGIHGKNLRYDSAYYQLFPERVKQDFDVLNQYQKLTSQPPLDGKSDKP